MNDDEIQMIRNDSFAISQLAYLLKSNIRLHLDLLSLVKLNGLDFYV